MMIVLSGLMVASVPVLCSYMGGPLRRIVRECISYFWTYRQSVVANMTSSQLRGLSEDYSLPYSVRLRIIEVFARQVMGSNLKLEKGDLALLMRWRGFLYDKELVRFVAQKLLEAYPLEDEGSKWFDFEEISDLFSSLCIDREIRRFREVVPHTPDAVVDNLCLLYQSVFADPESRRELYRRIVETRIDHADKPVETLLAMKKDWQSDPSVVDTEWFSNLREQMRDCLAYDLARLMQQLWADSPELLVHVGFLRAGFANPEFCRKLYQRIVETRIEQGHKPVNILLEMKKAWNLDPSVVDKEWLSNLSKEGRDSLVHDLTGLMQQHWADRPGLLAHVGL